jgi:hypothetical protein
LIVIESPRIIEYRLHGANYQFQTWGEADFYDQLEELGRSIISHSGVQDEDLKREILDNRMVGSLLYMLNMADQAGDRRLVRKVGKLCQRLRHRLSARQRVITQVAAMTGWRPRRHRVNRLESLQS